MSEVPLYRGWFGVGVYLQRFRGGLVFKAHRLLYHSTLGLSVINKKKARNLFDPPRKRESLYWKAEAERRGRTPFLIPTTEISFISSPLWTP